MLFRSICELTLDVFAYHELKNYGEAEDRYDEIEKNLHKGESEAYHIADNLVPSTEESAYKQTKPYMEELNGFILSLEWELVHIKPFHCRTIELSESQISDLFYEKLADVPILSRMEKIAEYVIDTQETLRGKNMTDEEKQEILERFLQMYETRNLIEIYNRFLRETKRKPLELIHGMIRYEDVYPLLYLKYSIKMPPRRREVKHLVIDEMQDYSYLQYVLIQKLFDCPMTILGDRMQTLAEKEQDVMAFLPKLFGKGIHCVTLNKSYRSTVEITEFASQFTKESGISMVERHGEKPQVKTFHSAEEQYAGIKKDMESEAGFDTMAVLCLDAKTTVQTAKALKLPFLTKDSMKFQKGVSVLPFYLAKGLEFDVVYAPDLQNYSTPFHKQALYINATRALHTLRLYEIKPN